MIHATVLAANPTREEFLAIRRTKVTGTDIATILGFNKYSSLYNLVLEKRGLVPGKEENEAMWLGKQSEPHILAGFERRTGLKVRPNRAIFASEEHPWAAATPDALLDDDSAGLEAKLVGLHKAREYGESGSTDVPVDHYLQCMWYMGVLRLDRWFLCPQIGTRLQVHEIERDQALVYRVMQAGKEFYDKYIIGTETPEPTADDVATVTSLYPVSGEGTIEASEEHRALALEFAAGQLAEEEGEVRKLAARAKIEALMQEKERLKGADFTISWKSNKPKTVIDYEGVVVDAISKLPGKYSTEIQKMVAARTKTVPGPRVFRPTGPLFDAGKE